jgi:hypothetical protein
MVVFVVMACPFLWFLLLSQRRTDEGATVPPVKIA